MGRPRGRRLRHGRGALLAIGLAALVAGCGGSPSAPHTASTSASASASTAPGPATSDPSPPSLPDATPAAGKRLTLPGVSLALPQRWRIGQDTTVAADGYFIDTGVVYLDDTEQIGSTGVADLRRLSERSNRVTHGPIVRQPDREVGGVSGYVLTGSNKTYRLYYEYGTVRAGRDVQIAFEWRRPPKDAQQIIESVLASVQWS